MNRPLLVALLPLLLLLAGCGGPPAGTPTPLPASVARPVQPTPIYPGGADVFSLVTPSITPAFVTPAADGTELAATSGADVQRAAIKLFIENQAPSAVGIALGGATIYREQGSGVVGSVPVGGVLTITGKSADGRWYAVYDDGAVFGWASAGQVRVYGGEDLTVVAQPLDPAPIATLLAQAAEPVRVLDELMPQMEAAQGASATAVAALLESNGSPAATVGTATPDLAAEVVATDTPLRDATVTPVVVGLPVPTATAPLRWVVAGDARVNLRTQPETTAPIIRKLEPGSSLTVMGRSDDNAWMRVQVEGGFEGWVAAEFLELRAE